MRSVSIFLLALVVFGVSVFGGFVQDDRMVILGNPTIGKPEGLIGAWMSPYFFGQPESGAYRPLTSLSLTWDGMVFGAEAWGFRLVNVLLYGLICVGVYELGKRLQKKGDWAFWVAMLFAVLPIHSEAVSSIVGRGELLSGGLVILMLILVKDGGWGWSMVVYLLALLSKESAVVWILPWGLMLLGEKIEKEYKLGLLMTMGILLVGYFLLRWGVLGEYVFADNASMVENPLKFVGSGQRIMAAVGLVAFGVSKVVLPINLSYDYSFSQFELSDLTSWWFVLGLGGVLVSVWLLRKKSEVLNLGLAFVWLPLLVTGNIVKPIGTIFAERLWFLPSLGVVMVVGVIIVEVAKKGEICIDSRFRASPRGNDKRNQGMTGKGSDGAKGVNLGWVMTYCKNRCWQRLPQKLRFFAMTAIGVVVFLFAGRSVVRNMDWLSEDRLFTTDAEYVTRSVLAQSNAAAMYLKIKDFDQAKIYLDRAEAIYPLYPELMNNWGIYYLWSGDVEEAVRRFEKCLESYPGNVLCTSNLEDLNEGVK